MKYNFLGKTNLQISEIGFGGSGLGGIYGAIDEKEAIEAVHLAVQKGVNYFDVSPYYGITQAESVLGKALEGIDRKKIILSTKVGRYGYNDFDFSAAKVNKSFQESAKRLKTDYIDILLCHDIEFNPLQQVIEETLPALERLKKEGKVRFIGVSGYPLDIFVEICQAYPVDLILSYQRYCLFNTSLSLILPLLHEKGIGIINASPLGMGMLTSSGPPEWHPATEILKRKCKEAVELCQTQGINLVNLALKFSTTHPYISTTLVSMLNSFQVNENIRILEERWNPESLNKILVFFS